MEKNYNFLVLLLLTSNRSSWFGFAFAPSHQTSCPFRSVSTKRRRLSTSFLATSNDGTQSVQPSHKNIVRQYLGTGPNAIVREGCVLVAPVHEYHHLLMRATLFVYAIGLNEEINENVARAVIIDHPTAFTVGEMVDLGSFENCDSANDIEQNTMFRGGDMGKDIVMMLHSFDGHYPNKSDMIGTSGVYEGGLAAIMKLARDGKIANPDQQVKFFFNYMEFTESQLDHMFDVTSSENVDNKSTDLDSWMSLEVEASFILNGHYDRGGAWSRLRNAVRDMERSPK